MFYSHAVRRLLLAPGSRNLLEEDVDIFDAVGLMEDLERNDTREEARRTPEVETAFDEEAQGDGHAEDDPREAHNCWPRVRTLLFNKLFAFLSAVVCIINITTALGYVMLMNDPAPPKSSYIVG